ncbi:MAG: hypothetical protein F6K16_28215 [Symploca sp. SIO2B6]|nr:hypothetical protein [Symploca sp. SIO2B6]
MSQNSMSSPSDALCVIEAIRQRLLVVADNPPYRYLNTSSKDRAAYETQRRTFTGYTDEEIAAVESSLGVRLPAVYRAYLQLMDLSHGDLFCGSNLAFIDEYEELRQFAEELLEENDVDGHLQQKAVVFFEHQGYSFCYFIASGGFDTPIYQYVEGRQSIEQAFSGFAEMIDSEVTSIEKSNQDFLEYGGYFLTVENGSVSQQYPARASGIRPLELPEQGGKSLMGLFDRVLVWLSKLLRWGRL